MTHIEVRCDKNPIEESLALHRELKSITNWPVVYRVTSLGPWSNQQPQNALAAAEGCQHRLGDIHAAVRADTPWRLLVIYWSVFPWAPEEHSFTTAYTAGASFSFFPEVSIPLTQSNISRRVEALDPDSCIGNGSNTKEGVRLEGIRRHVN